MVNILQLKECSYESAVIRSHTYSYTFTKGSKLIAKLLIGNTYTHSHTPMEELSDALRGSVFCLRKLAHAVKSHAIFNAENKSKFTLWHSSCFGMVIMLVFVVGGAEKTVTGSPKMFRNGTGFMAATTAHIS